MVHLLSAATVPVVALLLELLELEELVHSRLPVPCDFDRLDCSAS